MGEICVLGRWGKVTGIRSGLLHLKNDLAIRRILFNWRPGSIYANTIIVSSLLLYLRRLNIPVVMHIHELEGSFPSVKTEGALKTVPVHYIAVSQAVKDNLVHKQGIPEEKISVVYEAIDTERIDQSLREPVSQAAEINADFVIGGAGNLASWRKGIDFWFHTALLI